MNKRPLIYRRGFRDDVMDTFMIKVLLECEEIKEIKTWGECLNKLSSWNILFSYGLSYKYGVIL